MLKIHNMLKYQKGEAWRSAINQDMTNFAPKQRNLLSISGLYFAIILV